LRKSDVRRPQHRHPGCSGQTEKEWFWSESISAQGVLYYFFSSL
jgi:hypothetical protein